MTDSNNNCQHPNDREKEDLFEESQGQVSPHPFPHRPLQRPSIGRMFACRNSSATWPQLDIFGNLQPKQIGGSKTLSRRRGLHWQREVPLNSDLQEETKSNSTEANDSEAVHYLVAWTGVRYSGRASITGARGRVRRQVQNPI